MKKLAIGALLLLLLATGVPETRYESEWRCLEAGSIETFEHSLGTRPMIVAAWVALPLQRTPPAVGVAVPHTERDVHFNATDHVRIVVRNDSDEMLCIQVVAEEQ